MKKTLLLALMAVFATTAVTAQDMEQRDDRRGMDPEKRIEKQVGRLDKKLKLTDEQKQQLKEYYGEFDKAQMARMEQRKKTATPSTAKSTQSSPRSRKRSMPK